MRDARGLAAGTREGRLSIVGQLLLWKFSGRAFNVGELQAEDLRSFIAQELNRVNSVSHATALASGCGRTSATGPPVATSCMPCSA